MGTGNSGEIDIAAIISAPLIAAARANSAMSSEQARFLMDTCFHQDDGVLCPVLVNMVITSSSFDHSAESQGSGAFRTTSLKFQMPLICLLPLNSLGIKNVDVKFNMEVTSVNQGGSNKPTVFKGRLAPEQHASGEDASIGTGRSCRSLKVSIEAGNLPLPKGVLELIDMYSRTIRPVNGNDGQKTYKYEP